jgi:phosphoglycerol transferase MdoB-like AlkP superfamily enzyme
MTRILKKISHYLSLAYYDFLFRAFLLLLSVKLLAFCVSTHLGIYCFISTFGSLLVALSFSLLLTSRHHKFFYLCLINLAFSLFLAIQLLYFKYFQDFLSLYNIDQLQQFSSIHDSILNLIDIEVLYFADLFFLPLMYFANKGMVHPRKRERLASFIIILSIGIYCNLDYLFHRSFATSLISRYLFAKNFGIVTYQADDVFSYLSTKLGNHAISSSELRFVKEHLTNRLRPGETHRYAGIGKGKNLVLIQVESLQGFVLERKLNGKEITPNLNTLLKSGILFRNIYDQTSAGSSSDALFLANCSLYPAAKGTVAFLYAQNRYDSLAKLLIENGYTTSVLHAYYKTFWNFEQLDKALGFEHQMYQEDFSMDEIIGWGVSDRSFFVQSLNIIKKLPSPFYLLMRTLTTHDPFDAVTSTIDDFPVDAVSDKLTGQYLRSMHYVDAAIGEFVHGLSKAGLLSQTVIVVYGDHRARLHEEGLRQIGIHDMTETRKIPLLISNSSWKIHDINDTIGGLIDLAPTLSSIMGVNMAGKVFLGKDLGHTGCGYVIFRDGSFIGPCGTIDRESARRELKVSDLIVEKDCVPLAKQIFGDTYRQEKKDADSSSFY